MIAIAIAPTTAPQTAGFTSGCDFIFLTVVQEKGAFPRVDHTLRRNRAGRFGNYSDRPNDFRDLPETDELPRRRTGRRSEQKPDIVLLIGATGSLGLRDRRGLPATAKGKRAI
jgi:hypothetical protein